MRYLLLTLDAFGTLFHPRIPIAAQYIQAAHSLGFLTPSPHRRGDNLLMPERFQRAFGEAFRAEATARPNYGRWEPGFGGPRLWWANVIRGCFERVVGRAGEGGGAEVALPPELVPTLLERFSSRQGYALFEDVGPFLRELRALEGTSFDDVVVGVVSNSDDRVPGVLRSLGLKVGSVRADQPGRLPAEGFERLQERREEGQWGDNDIDFVITSYEVGEEKPRRMIFDVAERQGKKCFATPRRERPGRSLDAANNESWVLVHVGDDIEEDYKGAVGAGWISFLLTRQGDAGLAKHTITAHDGGDGGNVRRIRSLLELTPELKSL